MVYIYDIPPYSDGMVPLPVGFWGEENLPVLFHQDPGPVELWVPAGVPGMRCSEVDHGVQIQKEAG